MIVPFAGCSRSLLDNPDRKCFVRQALSLPLGASVRHGYEGDDVRQEIVRLNHLTQADTAGSLGD